MIDCRSSCCQISVVVNVVFHLSPFHCDGVIKGPADLLYFIFQSLVIAKTFLLPIKRFLAGLKVVMHLRH